MEIFASITLGWTPILALVVDGSRVVQQVLGWTGGTGTAPATGLYVGTTGYVADIADAVDVRGSAGAPGAGVAIGGIDNQALTKINSTDYNTQWTTIDKTFVGLGNVDNTSDVNKPVSTAQQTVLNLKANLASPTFTGTVGGISASMVGLGNVPNADATNASNITSGTLPNARISGLPNANLANSTISGIALGSNLNDVTVSSGIKLNSGTTYNGSSAKTASLDITGLPSITPALSDEIAFSDVSNSNANSKTTITDILSMYLDTYMANNFEYFNDFISAPANASTGQDTAGVNGGTGSGNSSIISSDLNRPGQVRFTTGTTNTGRAGVSSSATAIRFSGGKVIFEMAINITQLSTSSERFQLVIGFADTQGLIDQSDAAYFLYDEGGVSVGSAASANWQIVTSNNSSRTFATTGTVVSATTWVTLKVEVNTDGTSVNFFINGAEVTNSPITTNIPTGTARVTGFGGIIFKSVGTTAVTFDADYLKARKNFTTVR